MFNWSPCILYNLALNGYLDFGFVDEVGDDTGGFIIVSVLDTNQPNTSRVVPDTDLAGYRISGRITD